MELGKSSWKGFACKSEGKRLELAWTHWLTHVNRWQNGWNSTPFSAVGRLIVSLSIRVSHRIRFRYDTSWYGDFPYMVVSKRPISYCPNTRIVSQTQYACPAKLEYMGLVHLKKQAVTRVISVITTIILCSSIQKKRGKFCLPFPPLLPTKMGRVAYLIVL